METPRERFRVRACVYSRFARRSPPWRVSGGASKPATDGRLKTGQFSPRRAITALTLAGDFRGLDWLLWNTQIDREDMLLLLVDDQICDVISGCLPALPTISPAARTDLARWQLLILRHAYAI